MLTSKPVRLLAGQLTCFFYSSQLQTKIYVLYTVPQSTLVLLECVFPELYMNPLESKDDIVNSRTFFINYCIKCIFMRKSVEWFELTIPKPK